MSTTYYMRLKDDKELNTIRKTIKGTESIINKALEIIAEDLYTKVTNITQNIINEDNFNKQFCNAASWYGGYPDEPEDYHLKKVYLSEIEDIKIEIGTYSGGGFHWKLNSVPDGYYDIEQINEEKSYDGWLELKEYSFPRSKEQFKEFMKKYKDKVEIVDEYGEIYTVTKFLKKVDEY